MEKPDEDLVETEIGEIEKALANTRLFLDQLEGSATAAHEQIGGFADDLDRRLARLRNEGDLASPEERK